MGKLGGGKEQTWNVKPWSISLCHFVSQWGSKAFYGGFVSSKTWELDKLLHADNAIFPCWRSVDETQLKTMGNMGSPVMKHKDLGNVMLAYMFSSTSSPHFLTVFSGVSPLWSTIWIPLGEMSKHLKIFCWASKTLVQGMFGWHLEV